MQLMLYLHIKSGVISALKRMGQTVQKYVKTNPPIQGNDTIASVLTNFNASKNMK